MGHRFMCFLRPLMLAACVFGASWQAMGAQMKAGIAKVDITPPLGTHMWGYFDRLQGAQGIRDPLYARVLVLDAGGRRLAYVDLDLGRTFGPKALDQLRTAAKQNGIEGLLVQATHTHAGPVILDDYPQGPPAWEVTDLAKIEKAIEDATQHLVPVRLGVGYGTAQIGYNRRELNPDGTVSMLWSNAARIPTWPVDPVFGLLRIDRMDGVPLAILVNYATHPVTFGPDNLLYSADFPGVFCSVVEQAFGGKPLAFFVQGAAGDINVFDATTPIQQDPVGRQKWAGKTLGEAAVKTAQRVHTTADENATLAFSEDLLPIRLRWNASKFHEEMLREVGPQAFEDFAPQIEEEMHLPVTTALIDGKLALFGMPGEPFVQFQMDLRSRCPVQDCFFLGYTNGYSGYFPTVQAATEGGYGASSATTWVQVGSGEEMVNDGIVQIERMLNRLKDVPDTQWISLPPGP